MRAIFQNKGKKGQKTQNIWKFGQKYAIFENALKKGSLMRAAIACMKELEYAMLATALYNSAIENKNQAIFIKPLLWRISYNDKEEIV